MHCGDQRHLGLCLGYVPALAYGSCRVSDQGTTLRASDLHNARATILNPFNNASFPKKRYKKSYHNRKPWLSSTLKECIKRKNELYISAKRNRISNEIYKNYKNRLSHLLKVSEKQYCQESLEKHRSNMRKTWEIIKMVINKNKNKTTNSEFLVNNRLTTDKTKVANGFNKYLLMSVPH